MINMLQIADKDFKITYLCYRWTKWMRRWNMSTENQNLFFKNSMDVLELNAIIEIKNTMKDSHTSLVELLNSTAPLENSFKGSCEVKHKFTI